MSARLLDAVPRPIRRLARGGLNRYHTARALKHLEDLAAGAAPIVAGPWMGEVGFELLYWVPFLRWFTGTFHVPPERLTVISRGGTASWYAPFAGQYRDLLSHLTPDEFRRRQEERVRELGEQKQTRATDFERSVLAAVASPGHDRSAWLHPSVMYGLLNPFWWQHEDESRVRRYTHQSRLEAPDAPEVAALPTSFVAVKFYFNESFPQSVENVKFVQATVRDLAKTSPVVSLTTGLALDDHGSVDEPAEVAMTLGGVEPSRNLLVQSAVVARASAFVGTYGGFAYLAPFYGVPSIAYYGDASAFSPRHLAVAHSTFSLLGVGDLLQVRQATAAAAVH